MDHGDDRTVRLNFSEVGASNLKFKVMEKLKEFMGDYTDDVLVDYVIVLLRNGRSKEEARNDLNVFLGDDSDSFVTWLWDDLTSNLGLYVQPLLSSPDEGSKTKSTLTEVTRRNTSHLVDPEHDSEKSSTLSKIRHNREWGGLIRDAAQPYLQSSEISNIRVEEKTQRRLTQKSRSLVSHIQKKRNRPDDQQKSKGVSISQSTMAAPRRILQFAVRDAVATTNSPILVAEHSSKRLRSVVSTLMEDPSLDNRYQRLKSVARVPSALSTAFKAVAEAANDVKKVRSSVNVFDRLSRSMDKVEIKNVQQKEHRESLIEGREYEEQYVENVTMLENETGFPLDYVSDNEGYDGANLMGPEIMDVSQSGTSRGGKGDDSVMLQYSVAKNADDVLRNTRNKNQSQPGALSNDSRKIVNISVNVNTWKPPPYQATREVTETDGRIPPIQENVVVTGKSDAKIMTGNHVTICNGNATHNADSKRELQKKLHPTSVPSSAVYPSEDVNSRIIFVSNVHFASTKDSLSRHFNKFGEILKVVIITDAATGKPKGAAYVEFMRQDAAEQALSLDGTSFMSRILKVTRRSAHQEHSPTISRSRGSPVRAVNRRFGRALTFRRATFGACVPIKIGARSMQWKRGVNNNNSSIDLVSLNTVPTSRALTYFRSGPKPNENLSTV